MFQSKRVVGGGPAFTLPAGTAREAGAIVAITAAGANALYGHVVTEVDATQPCSLEVEGIWAVAKTNVAIAFGALVAWTPAGNPVGGVAGSGAASVGGTTFLGYATKTALDTDAYVEVYRSLPIA